MEKVGRRFEYFGVGEGTRKRVAKGRFEYLGGGYPGKESLSTLYAGARLSTWVRGGGRGGGRGLGCERH